MISISIVAIMLEKTLFLITVNLIIIPVVV
jgi:hypothetical protein